MALQTYKIDGLDCSEEVAALQDELGRRPGVVRLEFDVINARMTVEHDTSIISSDQIITGVAATGMKAIPWQDRTRQPPPGFWQQRGRLLTVAAGGMFLLTGFLTHWAARGSVIQALAAGHDDAHEFPLISMLLYLTATIAGAWHVAPKALLAARKLRPDIHLLMMIAVIGAVAIGEWFEAASVAFLFALALLLEQWSVGRARRAIGALLNIAPPTARVLDARGRPADLPVENVPLGSTIRVHPGERVPLDGVVMRGETSVNQAPITGESLPIQRLPGDEVFAGTINEEGAVEIRTTRLSDDTTLARIIHMVEQAHSRRAQAQQWVDRFALYYTPAMLILALGIAVLPPLISGQDWSRWFYQALVILVIACPCALVISTPVSIVSAMTAAAKNGVLIKGGVYLELAGRLRAVAVDKTGTLTQNHPQVQTILPFHGSEPDLLALAAALESHSEHPLARAILGKAREMNIEPLPVERFRAVKGRGAEAIISGREYWIGSHRMMEERGEETPEIHAKALQLEDAGHSVVAVGDQSRVLGLISIADSLRRNARQAVLDMKKAGIQEVMMLTGDNDGTARAIAEAAELDDFRSELLPEDKVAAVTGLVNRHRYVAMIGDGINDAPAMAAASFGIAMAAMGSDAAIETADIALMSDDLEKVPWLIRHSRRALKIIQQNIIFALAVKALFITLAVMGLATLWMAIAADMGASLLVIFNALRLLGPRSTVA